MRIALPWDCSRSRLALLAVVAVCALGQSAPADELPFQVPPGFEVSLYADDSLAHDIFSMTVDSHGRVVVAGAGYIKILHDDDGDGRADRARLFSAKPASGAHGMVFLGNDLICTGDNAVMRLHDNDGDGEASGEPDIWAKLRHSEHGANGLIQGPDGWIYLICGNDAGVSELEIADTSPVDDPKCGAVVRLSRDGRQQEVFAHGFRNPYDLDFNPSGQLFTVDSDGERDHHLPWYAPTRLFDVQQGMEHGWLLSGHQRSWNRPQSFFDNVERLVEIGRGSPTGVVSYRHRQFPEHYRGGIFSACWTLGTVYYFPLEPAGSTYKSHKEIFLQTTGEIGFSPCDLAVSPEGDLLIAIGGRRTLGSVFRVRYKGPDAKPIVQPATELAQVLAADQPLSSWSRAKWQLLAARLGREAFERAMLDDQLPLVERIRAVEVLVDRFDGMDPAVVEKIAAKAMADRRLAPLVARVAWAVGRAQRDAAGLKIVAALTAADDPLVERVAWESIALMPPLEKDAKVPAADWKDALNSADRRVRTAAILSIEHGGETLFEEYRRQQDASKTAPTPAEYIARQRLLTFCCGQGASTANSQRIDVFEKSDSPALRGEVVRVLERILGDVSVQPGQAEVFSGYRVGTANYLKECSHPIVQRLAPAFPTPDAEVNRELARLMGMLSADDPKLLDAISRQWTSHSTTEDDIHYLIVSALLPGDRSPEITAREVQTLLNLETKLRAAGGHPSQNWPLRVAEMFEELFRRDPALAEHLVDDPSFGRPEHTLYAARLPGDLRLRAARKLLATAQASEDPPGSELIALVAELPAAESLPALRRYWGEVGLRDAIALALARQAAPEDRQRFVESLASVQPKVAEQAAKALVGLDKSATPAEIRAALAALRQACQVPEQKTLRAALDELLVRWTDGAISPDEKLHSDPAALWTAWHQWFNKVHPDQANILAASGSVDIAEWQGRLARLDWAQGDIPRGRMLFERKACHRCHQVSGQLGPDLTGAVARLSREDLFAAIIDPNKEVSPTFQTTRVITTAGQVYYGLLVYESPEATLLQTAPDTTVRIIGAERSDMQPVRQSLMPTGLLNGTSDQELADLYAYLKTLGKK